MKIRTLLLSLFMIFLLGDSQAQMKKIVFPQEKFDIQEFTIKPKTTVTQMNPLRANPVEYKPIDFVSLEALKSGLEPGFLNEKQVPAFIQGALRDESLASRSTSDRILAYLKAAAPMMKIKNPESEFIIKSDEVDDIGMRHIRMQQMHEGIPVYGSEVILHEKDNTIDFLNGNYYPSFELGNTNPTLTVQEGEAIVFKNIGPQLVYQDDMTQFGDMKTKSALVIYPYENQFLLAYHYTVYKNLIDRWEYFIDAQTGAVINKYESMCRFHNHRHDGTTSCTHTDEAAAEMVFLDGSASATALDLFNISRQISTYQVGSSYYLIDASREIYSSSTSKMPNNPNGVIWTINAFNTSPAKSNFRYDHVTSSNNQWNDKTSISAHYNGGRAFEYFRNTHNRQSINGNGGNIISFINVAEDDGSSMGNAFWNGQAMFYGNGDAAFGPLAKGLDVAGHEMSHGVIQASANLEYQGESGALNESFADVFGVMIDRDDWLIGEDVVKKAVYPSGALRDMSDPHNGARTNDFNSGWQPKHYNERYTGTQDNEGVHINSGIPNHAFYKFATSVGKDKAEKVYYRALTKYLTKSSKFVDCRVAVVKAATDLYSQAEVNAAKKAFDEVGILGDQGGNYEDDVDFNPGQEFLLTTGSQNKGLYLLNANAEQLAQLSNKTLISKPSVSDDGSEIVFVASDRHMYYITIDWQSGTFTNEQVLSSDPVWRNVIISKDGSKLAGLLDQEINNVYVYYFAPNGSIQQNTFELYNPTYSSGVKTGDVNYADAMEFDLSGEYIIYDAENELKSTSSGSILYWDISFIKVWNNKSNSFSLGEISKLYSSLPQGTSIGNPSFSKNSPYIIAFDFIDDDGSVAILGANIERGETGLIFENNVLGFPNYSNKDDKVVFDNQGNNNVLNVGVAKMDQNKIQATERPVLLTQSKRWATYFSNGQRVISSVEDFNPTNTLFTILENPVNQRLILQFNETIQGSNGMITVTDLAGKLIINQQIEYGQSEVTLNTAALEAGMYIVTFRSNSQTQSAKFVKQ
ncbi:MAG: M4 family metallopeptidase [Chitinophagales bacterium]|nr:M4 family metallopeptidase [Chitinophagales bacterium]